MLWAPWYLLLRSWVAWVPWDCDAISFLVVVLLPPLLGFGFWSLRARASRAKAVPPTSAGKAAHSLL